MQWEPTPPPPRAALRPLGLGEIIDGGFRILKRNLGALVWITAIFVIPIQVVTVLVNLSVLPQRETLSNGFITETVYVQHHSAATLLVALLFTAVLSLALRLLAAGAIARLVSQDCLGHPSDARESLRFASRRLLPLIGAALLAFLGTLLGLVACIIPGIFLAVSWSVATPALIVEGIGPRRALGRSMKLVRPRWWAVLGYEIVIGLLVTVPTLIVALPVAAIVSRNTAGGVVANGIATGIISLFATPFAAATIVLLYIDLRVRHEGFDITLMTQALDHPAPGAPPAATSQPAPPPPAPPAPPAGGGRPNPPEWGSPTANEWGAPPQPPG